MSENQTLGFVRADVSNENVKKMSTGNNVSVLIKNLVRFETIGTCGVARVIKQRTIVESARFLGRFGDIGSPKR